MNNKPLEDAALLIIDMQVGLFDHKIYQGQALLDTVCGLAERATRQGAPVIYVQHANKNMLVEGSPAFALHPGLHPLPGDGSIVKHHGSALEDTPLEAELRAKGIQTLVITGLVTHGCVRATALDALKRGFRVALVSNGHSSYAADAAAKIKEWNAKIGQAGAELWPAGEVFA